MKPDLKQIPSFYRPYIEALEDKDLMGLLSESLVRFDDLTSGIAEGEGDFRYDHGKWTIKQVVQHLIDGERVFTYRALRFARGDKTDLPGFDQDDYAANCEADRRTLSGLIAEFKNLRKTTIDFFQSLSDEQLRFIGTANQYEFSVNSIGYITVGHLVHHLNILEERYLPKLHD